MYTDKRGRHGKHRKGPRVERISIVCAQCGNVFEKLPGFLKQHPDTKYCSLKCRDAGLTDPKTKTTVNCDYCGVEFSKRTDHLKNKNYCSKKCSDFGRSKNDALWKNKDHIKKYMKNYSSKNRDSLNKLASLWREKNKEKRKTVQEKYRKNNKDKITVSAKKRNGIVLSGDLTTSQWKEIKKKYDFRCAICNKQEPEIKLTLDHIIPVSKGGTHTASNVQPLCKSCNSRKGNKLVEAIYSIKIVEV